MESLTITKLMVKAIKSGSMLSIQKTKAEDLKMAKLLNFTSTEGN